jgi:hypothetical protein
MEKFCTKPRQDTTLSIGRETLQPAATRGRVTPLSHSVGEGMGVRARR